MGDWHGIGAAFGYVSRTVSIYNHQEGQQRAIGMISFLENLEGLVKELQAQPDTVYANLKLIEEIKQQYSASIGDYILKTELISSSYEDIDKASLSIGRAIIIYNFKRRHSSLNYQIPHEVHLQKGPQIKRWKNYYTVPKNKEKIMQVT